MTVPTLLKHGTLNKADQFGTFAHTQVAGVDLVAGSVGADSQNLQNLLEVQTRASWSPLNLPGVVAYWNADDCTGGSGAAVASWTDRIGGIVLSQGTGAQQPTIVTNSGGTGHQGLRFTAASHQLLTGAIGSIPQVGPLWVWAIRKDISHPTGSTLVEASTAATLTKGWRIYSNASTWFFQTINGTNQSLVGGDAIGTVYSRLWAFDPLYSQQVLTKRNNQANAAVAAWITANATSGVASFTIGASIADGSDSLDAEVLVVVVGSGNPPSALSQQRMAQWVAANYKIATGTGYNAPTSVNVSGFTHTGVASVSAVELSHLYDPAGIFGHKFWCAFMPYDAAAADENPSVNFSDDGNTWSAGSIANPIVAYPGGGTAGNNADLAIFDNRARDGKLYIYYVVENSSANNGVYALSSQDGVSWTSLGKMATANDANTPCVCYDPVSGLYWLFTVPSGISRQTSSSPTGPWSTAQPVTINIPWGVTPWHMSRPIQIGSKWVITFSDSATNRNIWIASSVDGLSWNCSATPLAVPGFSSSAWDNLGLYRPSIVDAQDGSNLYFWYAINTGSGTSKMSQIVTVPQSVIP